MPSGIRLTIVAMCCAFAVACAGGGPAPVASGRGETASAHSESSCRATFAAITAAVAETSASDAQDAEVAGFPYLRLNRFWAAIGSGLDGDDARAVAAWAERLRRLDAEARQFELANMPPEARARLGRLFSEPDGAKRLIERCGRALAAADLADPANRHALLAAARVPDSYSDVDRVLGLYPLTSMPVAAGWNAWKRANLGTFATTPDALPVAGMLRDFAPPATPAPPAPDAIAAILAAATDPVLDVPEPAGDDLAVLVATYAPVWRIDVGGPSDAIGAPNWPVAGRPVSLEPHRPMTYVHVGHALFAGRPVLQISYQIWFPSRPAEGRFDLLAGRLDSVIWRVSIGPDGRALVYDTIHGCGCYHLFFPVPPVRARPLDEVAHGFDESATVAASGPPLEDGRRVVVRIASGSHYVVALATTDGGNAAARSHYTLAPADALRSLPVPGGHRRSLYGPDGLVAGTERLERFVLWPMGVRSPGAMRQWGHHATAFVGRRHFDDPNLLDEAFVR